MALSESEIIKAKDLQEQGYTNDEIKAFIGAERVGQLSPAHREVHRRQEMQFNQNKDVLDRINDTTTGKVFNWIGQNMAGNASDVFGAGLARRGIGTKDADIETVREYVDEPTKAQYTGAVLQTAALAADVGITVGTFGAATPWTVARNVAVGGTLGYAYDVGDDLVEQQRLAEIVDPDWGTVIGVAAPLAFAGAGAAYRGVAGTTDDVGRAVARPVAEATKDAGEQAVERATNKVSDTVSAIKESDTVTGLTEQARGVYNRVPRAFKNAQETIADNAERAALREGATPQVQQALDNGLDTKTINRVTNPNVPLAPGSEKFVDNAVQQDAYRQVVLAAKSDAPEMAEYVSGSYATEMYKVARSQQQSVGKQLGKARDSLGTDAIPFSTEKRSMLEVLKSNGITVTNDGKITTRGLTDQEENAINQIWRQLSKYDLDNVTPQDVNEIDQLLSRMQRQTTASDNLETVYIKVPNAAGDTTNVNIFSYIRDTFDSKLQTLDTTGEIARLKREYGNLAKTTGEIENTWFRNMDTFKSTDDELAKAASIALRRLDGRAQSGVTYGQTYNRLDLIARANGYTGANAADVSNFYLKSVEPLYTGTTPPASFGGPFASIRQTIANVLDVGGVQNRDKQRALEGLLDIVDETPTTTGGQVIEPETVAQVQDLTKRLNESSKFSVSNILRNNRQAGFININPLGSSITPEGVAKVMDDADFDAIAMIAEDVRTARLDPEVNKLLKTMKLDKAPDDELEMFLRETSDEYERLHPPVVAGRDVFNQSATTKTTNLLEEAKGKTLEEFVRAQGTPVYHGTKSKIDQFRSGVMGENTGAESAKKGFFFGSSKENSLRYMTTARTGKVDTQKEINTILLKELERRGLPTRIPQPNSSSGFYEFSVAKPKELGTSDTLVDLKGDLTSQWINEGRRDLMKKKSLIANTPEEELLFDKVALVYENVVKSVNPSAKQTEQIGELVEAYLDYKNPKIIVDRPKPVSELNNDPGRGLVFSEEIDKAISEGHDALIIKNTKDPLPTDVYVVFSPDQIKTRTQLEDIWKKANRTASADTPSLMEEAKGKTLDEFVKAQPVPRGTVKYDFDGEMFSIESKSDTKKLLDSGRVVPRDTASGWFDAEGFAHISRIDAGAKGTRFYERVLIELKEQGHNKIAVTLQSAPSQGALKKLVDEGKLMVLKTNETGVPTHFKITDQIKTRTQLEDIWKQANE